MKVAFGSDVLVVLTTAPAGLGHIRVMEALAEGLSERTRTEVMGVNDPGMTWIHRLTSVNPTLKRVMEFTQENRMAEHQFTVRYRNWLRSHAAPAAGKLRAIVTQSPAKPKTVVVLATHFGLAHQLAAMKEELIRLLGVRLVVAVVVTDDSPQELWAVNGADVIFVPSNTTREHLLTHLLAIGGPVPEVMTVPYPISLSMGEPLSVQEFQERRKQVCGHSFRLMVPISGAAVQLSYFRDLIGTLCADGTGVSVVSRESDHTRPFLNWCRNQSSVDMIVSNIDREVVEAYEREYMLSVYGAEVTKPSEQAFKALYTPRQRGGVVLLFSPPVGRQEKDNMAFLRRHRMMPSVDDQARINEWCMNGNRLHLTKELLDRAHHWRGVMLPDTGMWAGIAVKRLVEAGVLAAMADFRGFLEGHDEIRSDGVREVWEQLSSLI